MQAEIIQVYSLASDKNVFTTVHPCTRVVPACHRESTSCTDNT